METSVSNNCSYQGIFKDFVLEKCVWVIPLEPCAAVYSASVFVSYALGCLLTLICTANRGKKLLRHHVDESQRRRSIRQMTNVGGTAEADGSNQVARLHGSIISTLEEGGPNEMARFYESDTSPHQLHPTQRENSEERGVTKVTFTQSAVNLYQGFMHRTFSRSNYPQPNDEEQNDLQQNYPHQNYPHQNNPHQNNPQQDSQRLTTLEETHGFSAMHFSIEQNSLNDPYTMGLMTFDGLLSLTSIATIICIYTKKADLYKVCVSVITFGKFVYFSVKITFLLQLIENGDWKTIFITVILMVFNLYGTVALWSYSEHMDRANSLETDRCVPLDPDQ